MVALLIDVQKFKIVLFWRHFLMLKMFVLIYHLVQGTLKGLLQHHSSKASSLQRSAFFIVQLSHPYMATGKTISSVQFISVAQSCPTLCDPMNRSAPGLPVHHSKKKPATSEGVPSLLICHHPQGHLAEVRWPLTPELGGQE